MVFVIFSSTAFAPSAGFPGSQADLLYMDYTEISRLCRVVCGSFLSPLGPQKAGCPYKILPELSSEARLMREQR